MEKVGHPRDEENVSRWKSSCVCGNWMVLLGKEPLAGQGRSQGGRVRRVLILSIQEGKIAVEVHPNRPSCIKREFSKIKGQLETS